MATGHVCAFPWLHAINKMLEAEAVRRGFPPMQAVVEDTSVDDLQHAANWTAVATYLETITLATLDVHLPFRASAQ